MARNLSILPETTSAIAPTRQEAQTQPLKPKEQPLLKIAGLDRVLTADGIDTIQGTRDDLRLQLSDGAALQVRNFDPEELVQLLNRYVTSPFVALRTRGVSGRTIFVNSGTLTGFNTATRAMPLIYFGTRVVQLDGGFSALDLQSALEAAGRVVVTIQPTPPLLAPASPQMSSVPAYDIDRFGNLPGRV